MYVRLLEFIDSYAKLLMGYIGYSGRNISVASEEIEDRRLSFVVIFQFCMLITNHTFKHVLGIENTLVRQGTSLIFMVIVGVLFLKNFKLMYKRVRKIFIYIYAVATLIIIFNMIAFMGNIPYILDVSFWIFFMCIPVSLYYLAIRNKKVFLEMFVASAYYQIAVGIIYWIGTDLKTHQYDMPYSYMLMVPVIILLYKLYKKFVIVDFILLIAGFYSMFMLGSRGPMLSIVIFCITMVIMDFIYNPRKVKSMAFLFSGLTVAAIGNFFIKDIAGFLYQYLRSVGIYNRNLYILATSDIDLLAGRSPLYDLSIQKVLENPFFGNGIAGDRLFLEGNYPHNIFLEIVVQFGIPLGIIMVLTMVFLMVKALFLNSDETQRNLAVLFFGVGVVQLLVSASYLTSVNFWLFMTISICSLNLSGSFWEKLPDPPAKLRNIVS